MRVRLRLTGPLTRQSGVFGGVVFKHGVAVVDGQAHEVGNVVTYLQRCYNVEYANEDAVDQADGDGQADRNGGVRGAAAAQATQRAGDDQAASVSSGRAPDGGGGQGAEGPQVGDKLRKAILQLDPENSEHWTGTGKPMLNIIEKFYGSSGVTRADVQAAIPGYDREAARAAKAG